MLYLFSNVELDFILLNWFCNTKRPPKLYKYRNYCVLTNACWIYFGIALDLLDKDFLDRNFSETDTDTLETDIDCFPGNILLVSQTPGRQPQDISSRLLEDMSWQRTEDIPWRGLEGVLSLAMFGLSWWRLRDDFIEKKCLLSTFIKDLARAIATTFLINYWIWVQQRHQDDFYNVTLVLQFSPVNRLRVWICYFHYEQVNAAWEKTLKENIMVEK